MLEEKLNIPEDAEIESVEENKLNTGNNIDPALIEQLKKASEVFNVDINGALATLLLIADVLVNNEDLANLVLLEAKNNDGVLTTEELNEFLATLDNQNNQQYNAEEQGLEGIMKQINSLVPNVTPEVVMQFIKEKSGTNPEILTDDNAFINLLKDFTSSQVNIKNVIGNANEEVKEKLEKDDKEPEKLANEIAKVKVISLTKKGDVNNKEMPMGKDWIKAAVQNIKK